MSSLRKYNGTRNKGPKPDGRKRPWQARVKKEGESYFLGYFATKEEADAVEQEFRDNWDELRGTW